MHTDKFKYADILYKSPPQLKKHPPMSMHDRAAQFAPFAALTGHKDAAQEIARVTESKIELDENQYEHLNIMLSFLLNQENKGLQCEIIHFKEDEKKNGGEYIASLGTIKKFDEVDSYILMESGEKIKLKNIYKINI